MRYVRQYYVFIIVVALIAYFFYFRQFSPVSEFKRLSAYKLIEEENLPKPTKIQFRSPLSGVLRKSGTCIKTCYTNEYRILIYLTQKKWIQDDAGTFTFKSSNIRYRKGIIGKERPFSKVIETLAHEIAHLKFWNHNPEHKSYINYLFDKLNQKIGDINGI